MWTPGLNGHNFFPFCKIQLHEIILLNWQFNIPDRRQWKTLFKQSTNIDQSSLETVFSIAIWCQLDDKWQSKTLFLTIFDLRSSIVLTFLIAPYTVCFRNMWWLLTSRMILPEYYSLLIETYKDESVYLKLIFLHVVGTQKNRLNETVLLSTQNKSFNWWIRNIYTFTLGIFVYLESWPKSFQGDVLTSTYLYVEITVCLFRQLQSSAFLVCWNV